MSKRDYGGPAFPVSDTVTGDKVFCAPDEAGWSGMTLRDYFAAKAMAAHAKDEVDPMNYTDRSLADLASVSYAIADAMLKERAK